MPSAFESSIQTSDKDMRNVIVQMLVGISHIRAEQNEGVVQDGSISIIRCCHFCDEMRQHFNVILIDFRKVRDSTRIFAVMRHAMETRSGSFTFRISSPREIARKQKRAYPGDI